MILVKLYPAIMHTLSPSPIPGVPRPVCRCHALAQGPSALWLDLRPLLQETASDPAEGCLLSSSRGC